jgi:predicted unusual protein kinase regulating ubiquinone biosynthesis (AarF/ABC1/UbiB family)
LIKTKDGRLAYLDFGLISEIPETVRYSFISAILNLLNREYESLAKNLNGMALIRNDDLDKEIEKLTLAFFETFDKSLSDFDGLTFQEITEKIIRLTFKFPFFLPPYFLNNLRAIATLEGLALMADPDFKIADVIYPYIINKLLTNPAPQFQAALEDFLIDRNNMKPNWNRLEALLQDPEWTKTFSEKSENILTFFRYFRLSGNSYQPLLLLFLH